MYLMNKKMSAPYISIITVVYNDKKGMEFTAKSVASQTALSQAEWIIIDANSQDGTKDIINKYKEYATYTISEPDEGIYYGMNKGIAIAKGKYCIFMNAGDSFYDNTVIENIIKEPFFGNTDYILGNSKEEKGGRIIGSYISPKKITARFFFTASLCHQSTLISTERLKKFGGYDTKYRITADAKFFFEDLILRDATFNNTDIIISTYNVEGISYIQASEAYKEKQEFLNELIKPRIKKDIDKVTFGETPIEKVLCKIHEKSFRYKTIQTLAILMYSPTALNNRIRMIFRNKKKTNL